MPRPKDGPSGVGYPSPAEHKYEYDTFYDPAFKSNGNGIGLTVRYAPGTILPIEICEKKIPMMCEWLNV